MPQSISTVPSKHRIPGEDLEEAWVSTQEMCLALDICRSTLYRVRTADGLMQEGVHFIRKNPTSIRCGHLLWSPEQVRKVFQRHGG
jgi:hypothetical protein